MLVSVIIPFFNSENTIQECISSVTKQSYKHIEIIAINDGSTDSGQNIVDAHAREDDRLIILHTANKGVSSARNLGIELSQGDYITFVDADDTIDKDHVLSMIKLITEGNQVVVSDYWIVKVYNDKKVKHSYKKSGRKKYISEKKSKNLKFLLQDKTGVSLWTKLYPRTILSSKIRFDEELNYGEDLFFNFKVFKMNPRIIHTNYSSYNYVINSQVDSLSKNNNLQEKNWRLFIKFTELEDNYLDKETIIFLFNLLPRLLIESLDSISINRLTSIQKNSTVIRELRRNILLLIISPYNLKFCLIYYFISLALCYEKNSALVFCVEMYNKIRKILKQFIKDS